MLRYFTSAPGPFEYLEAGGGGAAAPADLARATLWGLERCAGLRPLWPWARLAPMLGHADADVRWCGARCVALALGLQDRAASALTRRTLSADEAVAAALRWQDACALAAAEAAAAAATFVYAGVGSGAGAGSGAAATADEPLPHGSPVPRKRKLAETLAAPPRGDWPPLPPGYVRVCGLELPVRAPEALAEGPAAAPAEAAAPFVPTPTALRNLEALAAGLALGSPLLLEGPPGAGKSALVEHAAALTGNAASMVRVQLDDQMDAKALVGAYACAARPGEFVWQPGPLAHAAAAGRWVLIEDVNLAPPEVLATLAPLLERGELAVPSRAEVLRAAPGFQVIATVTTAPGGGAAAGAYGSAQPVRDLLGGLLHAVAVEAPPAAEQADLLRALHPQLGPLLPPAMATLAAVRIAFGQWPAPAPSDAPDAAAADAHAALALGGVAPGEFSLGRHFSFRDLLKWARRVARVHAALLRRALRSAGDAPDASAADLPVSVREAAFAEAADCFCAVLARDEARGRLLRALAAIWAVPEASVEQLEEFAKPAIAASADTVTVGRAALPIAHAAAAAGARREAAAVAAPRGGSATFASTGHAMRAMERVAVAVACAEPVLLVGETGTGKTTLVQEVAARVGARLVVLNLSQQTDASDLVGGYRPVQPSDAAAALLEPFAILVRRTWRRGNNDEFLGRVLKLAAKRKWGLVLKAFRTAVGKVGAEGGEGSDAAAAASNGGAAKKPRKAAVEAVVDAELARAWRRFAADLAAAEATVAAAEGGFAFAFAEGALVKAVREGWWLLLDEVNLAPAEALERIAGLLDGERGGLTVAERGDIAAVPRHPEFRLFAAMNPATDAGKRELPAPLRNRFTELWVGEPRQREDLAAIVAQRLVPACAAAPVAGVVDFYLAAKGEADATLQDGAGHKPAYNLRTLSRALEYAAACIPVYGLHKALYDGFSMSFLTQLDPESAARLEGLMRTHLLGGAVELKALMRAPPSPPSPDCVRFDQFWVQTGGTPVAEDRDADGSGGTFVSTPTVLQHLRNLARAVLLRKYPILLQGPTSSGKTSLVAYLAAQTGHRFVRINNHEQTDLQEYLGTYVSDEQGHLVFQEGLLVQAVRRGHWIVLDELNLAPTEVLEALNRLLDDNRELYVPELQEVVKPHPHFMLFATQNPPGIYAGRKVLSRAFRSRFLELHVEDIPEAELQTILERRCTIAPSYAAKLVSVMRELQLCRASSNVFAGRHGFITPRDLFRWAGRGAIGYQQLAEDGFAVLAERLRTDTERATVHSTLQKLLGAKLNMQVVYEHNVNRLMERMKGPEALQALQAMGNASVNAVSGVVWTPSLRRIFYLLDRCLEFQEPALLVGETGAGKTTVCQMAAASRGQCLHVVNCNQHTETSDFIGGYRPNRHRERAIAEFQRATAQFNMLAARASLPVLDAASDDIVDIVQLAAKAEAMAVDADDALRAATLAMTKAAISARRPFEWMDGPLVEAMRNGDMILIDELNLAEDAVIERLNSVLEPGRTLTLAEKGSAVADVIVAHPDFRIVATMNPGGDYGKKELSPALSNRFTSIWVPGIENEAELLAILQSKLLSGAEDIAPRLLAFWQFWGARVATAARQTLTVRDLLAWAVFFNATTATLGPLLAYVHGAYLVVIDGIGLGVGVPDDAARAMRAMCHDFLLSQLPSEVHAAASEAAGMPRLEGSAIASCGRTLENAWGVAPFYVPCCSDDDGASEFDFNAPTTVRNSMRVLRALQLRKPVLLEGSPGVGKTSLVVAMAKAAGREFVRINLSDQTDMMDLLGADLPVEGGAAGEFAWSDGPLLSAIKTGAWLLLDELNLANQTVLEGLNAVLDHRAEVFIPELNSTFRCPENFRVFAAQNPLQEGGGRKGLPRSFLNRFTRVHVELLQADDLAFIAGTLHPGIPSELLQRMVRFVGSLHHDANIARAFASSGGPWEFNLRDLLRWCELISSAPAHEPDAALVAACHYGDMLFVRRLRTELDRAHVRSTFQAAMGAAPEVADADVVIRAETVQFGWARVERAPLAERGRDEERVLTAHQAGLIACVAECVSRGWMCLLSGPAASGKTAVVRTLAELCGRPLIELSLNSGTDASDLLGGFEQVDVGRRRKEFCRAVRDALAAATAAVLEADALAEGLDRLQAAALAWSAAEPQVADADAAALGEAGRRVLDEADAALAGVPAAPAVGEALAAARRLGAAVASAAAETAGRFEWVDGALTRAIADGRWVVLDNANLCSPSVLDRLNPLLEPRGVLYLNECGTGPAGPRMIRPHPDFRLFLLLDPKHGEVSRAMRNRGIEVFALPPAGGAAGGAEDAAAVLGLAGVPGVALPRAMAAAHGAVVAAAGARHRRAPSLRELKRWARLAAALAGRGWEAWAALAHGFEHVYVRPETLAAARAEARAALEAHCSRPGAAARREPWFRPAVWPVGLGASAFAADSALAAAARDAGPALLWLGRLAAGEAELPPAQLADATAAALGLAATAMLPGEALRGVLAVDFGEAADLDADDAEAPAVAAGLGAALAAVHQCADRAVGREGTPLHATLAAALLERAEAFAGRALHERPAVGAAHVCGLAAQLLASLLAHPLAAARAAGAAVPARKWAALHAAAEAAAALRQCAASVAAGVNLPTLLQLSCWHFQRPKERARSPAPHAAVDWLWPLLQAVQACEEGLLGADTPLEADVPEELGPVQEWRASVLVLAHFDPGSADHAALGGRLEELAFAWTRLRKAAAALGATVAGNGGGPWAAGDALRHVGEQLDAALGMGSGGGGKPRLWKRGGRPLLPKSAEAAAGLRRLLALCAATRVGADGFELDHRDQPAALAAAGVEVRALGALAEAAGTPEGLEPVGAAAAAAIAADPALRLALLDGLCIFQAATLLGGREEAGLPELLAAEAGRRAEAAAEAAAAALAREAGQGSAAALDAAAAADNAGGGAAALPQALPAELMTYAAGRALQRPLLALLDLTAAKAALVQLAGAAPDAGVLLLLDDRRPPAAAAAPALRALVAAIAAGGCRDVAEAAPFQLLLWTLEARAPAGAGAARWGGALQQSLAHEAYFRWHSGLWRGAAAAAPAGAEALGAAGAARWAALEGPARLHAAALTAHVAALATDWAAPISAHQAKLLQLRLAARHLRGLCAPGAPGAPALAAAEWRAAALVSAATLAAHRRDFPEGSEAPGLVDALAAATGPRELADAGALAAAARALEGCAHAGLRAVGEAALLPALGALLSADAARPGPEGLRARGEAWALLGLARLHLLAPPPGADPAAKHALLRRHALELLAWRVRPELAARGSYAALPGGPDQAAALAALRGAEAELVAREEALDGRSPPRPDPPRYLALHEDVARFLGGLAAAPRVRALVAALGRGEAGAAEQAAVWRGNAGAWAARLAKHYGGYADVAQPVAAAVHEVCYGLALAAGAAALCAATAPATRAVARLMAFPRAAEPLAPADRLEAAAVHAAVGAAAAATARERAALRPVAAGATAAAAAFDADAEAAAAALLARLKLLRAAMHEAAGEARGAGTAAARHAAGARLAGIFASLLAVWEEAKAEEARRAAEEAELFKSRARAVEVPTEEDEDEAAYLAAFPDQFAAFADLAEDDGPGSALADAGAPAAAPPPPPPSAAFFVKEFVYGELLAHVVAAHRAGFGDGGFEAAVEADDDDASAPGGAAAGRAYALGAELVLAAGGALPAAVDDATLTGHLYAAAGRARALGRGAAPAAAAADVRAACPEEAVLAQRPLQALRARLAQLLEEWPDHPVLAQLDAVAGRALAMPVASPLKAVLAGLELLLARAQVWEETAAKHVTLAPELRGVAALATRWRRLELGGWRRVLDDARARAAARANAGWFHLYRILFAGDAPAEEVALAAEDFVQAAPLGEFRARLALLAAFRRQLLAAASDASADAADAGAAALSARAGALAAALANLGAYYARFAPAVDAAIAATLGPLEKDLSGFVSLAKWEDRGYYALRHAADKAQRQLHRLSRKAANALGAPARGVLAPAAAAMGLGDLAAPAVDNPEAAPAAVSKGWRGAAPAPDAPDAAALVDAAAAGAALAAARAAAGEPVAPPPGGGRYTAQLPALTRRFGAVVARALAAETPAVGAFYSADDLAGRAAERALALRGDVAKGARARKKKALVDLLRALVAAGASRRRSAVPAEHRGARAWVAAPTPDVGPLLRGAAGASAAGCQAAAAAAAWAKADAYHYGGLARLRRLAEAAAAPSGDLSAAEVEAAVALSEHLAFLSQRGRRALGRLGPLFARLDALHAALGGLAAGVPAQDGRSAAAAALLARLARLADLAAETGELLTAAAAAETDAGERAALAAGAGAAGSALAAARRASAALRAAWNAAAELPSGERLVTAGLAAAADSALATLHEACAELAAPELADLPGWCQLATAFEAAATAPAPAAEAVPSGAAAAAAAAELPERLEATVAAALVWAQGAHAAADAPVKPPTAEIVADDADAGAKAEDENEEEEVPLPAALDDAERRLGLGRLEALLSEGYAALAALAALADGDAAGAAAGAAALLAAAPLLAALRAALWQLAARALAAHRSVAKLAYVVAALFAGVAAEGFCMPSGQAEGEEVEGEAKVAEGTGLGEGDTTGARDITDELADQDLLLGAQKAGEEKEEPADEVAPQPDDGARGAEMDEDFEGAMEDLQPAGEEEEEDGDAAGDEARVEQQMGDAGDGAEDVDEKLWGGEDEEEGGEKRKEEEGLDRDAPVGAADAANPEFAQGGDEPPEEEGDEGGARGEDAPAPAPRAADGGEAPPSDDEMGGEESEGEGAVERPDDRGFVKPEAPAEELQLPEDLNLDGDGDAGGDDDGDAAEGDAAEGEDAQADDAAAPREAGTPEEDEAPEGEAAAAMDEDGAAGEEEEPEGGGAPPEGALDEMAGGEEEAADLAPEEEAEEEAAAQARREEGGHEEAAPALGSEFGLPTAAVEAAPDAAGAAQQRAAAAPDAGERPDAAAPAPADANAEPAEAAGGSAAGASAGLQDDASAAQASAAGAPLPPGARRPAPPAPEANPFRDLGSALERFRARLAVLGDAAADEAGGAEDAAAEREAAAGGGAEEEEPEGAGGEFRFLGEREGGQRGDTQALAPATEEQAAAAAAEERDAGGGADEAAVVAEDAAPPAGEQAPDEAAMDVDDDAGPAPELLGGEARWGAGAAERPAAPAPRGVGAEAEAEGDGAEGEGEEEVAEEERAAAPDSFVVAALRAATLEDGAPLAPDVAALLAPLGAERAAALRAELDRRLRAAAEGGGAPAGEHGREVWARCEALTAGLVGELAEQLRLILEPTLATRLAGDFRAGKRINMKRVIGYIASRFRRDKIWLRRTRPDRRRYQVVLAVDDSRSMAETGCGGFALEAVTLLARALSRLDVGELGVVSFGGGGGAVPLHALGAPFSDADGARVMSGLRFDADNTIADRPMLDVVASLDHLLAGARARASGTAAGAAALHQLVLIVADGRFHEKEALRRAAREAAARPGVLYAFIVLDNPAHSILDMQSVGFAGGKPVFSKYLDAFPFPFYIVLRDTAALPRTLADLLRQWFEMTAGAG